MFCDVVITKKAYELDRLFCYRVPRELEDKVERGKRVIVPFGSYGKTEGIIFKFWKLGTCQMFVNIATCTDSIGITYWE